MSLHTPTTNQVNQTQKFAFDLADKCPSSPENAGQCRQRNDDLVNEETRMKKDREWSETEINLLKKLFIEHGLKWTFMTKYFEKRTENCLKNKFYNSLRKAARKLMDLYSKKIGASCKSILTCEMLTILLELCHQLSAVSGSHQLRSVSVLSLLEVRDKILEIAFSGEIDATDPESAYCLIKQIRKLNANLRCFGVYKTKKRKNWDLKGKRLERVLKVINSSEGEEKQSKSSRVSVEQEFIESQPLEKKVEIAGKSEESFYYSPQQIYWMSMKYYHDQMQTQAQLAQFYSVNSLNQFYIERYYKRGCFNTDHLSTYDGSTNSERDQMMFRTLESCLRQNQNVQAVQQVKQEIVCEAQKDQMPIKQEFIDEER